MKPFRHWRMAAIVPFLILGMGASAAGETPKPAQDAKPATDTKPATDAKPAPDAKAAIGPRFTIDKNVVDIGEVIRGKAATAVFDVSNTGDEVLKILSAKPG